jgi:ribose/xylose/arabinose/galactoside ABC-type transport system permease subunit
MTRLRNILADEAYRPALILLTVTAIFAVVSAFTGTPFGKATLFSVLQNFATIGPVALGLGLTMLIREFDISVAGMFSLGGCVGVIVGNYDPALGLLAALGVGLAGGFAQGVIMCRMGLDSVAVTLGGFLTFSGLAAVITGNRTVPFRHLDLALALDQPTFGVFSWRNLSMIFVFALAAVVVSYTRVGRDMIATGSHRHASAVAGVKIERVMIGTFSASGALAAFSGALLAFGLAAAAPSGLSEVLVPAVTAAILGGVSLWGGIGTPLGIAAGALVLSLLRTGLTGFGVSPYMYDVITGMILFAVAIADAPDLARRVFLIRRGWKQKGDAR